MQLQKVFVPEHGDHGVGVCTDNHNRGGDDGDGGGDHVSAEPLQTLCAILHQPAQPGEAEGREPLIRGKPVAFGKHRVREWNNRGEGNVVAGAAASPAVPGCSVSRFSYPLSPSFSSFQQQIYTPRPSDRLAVPSFLQRDRFNRFQPTYPYMQHEIDLPPTISLSDGEEPPPYQGPCTLQLRDPEQQMELNRESVRAPPNRTIFDSDLIDNSVYGGPCPPSSNSGISATCYGSNGRMEGPPPTYSEVIGHYPGSTFYQHQQNNNGMPSILEGSRLHHSQLNGLESTTAWNKEKEKQKGHPF
uniref:Prostate transmembrane protein, androgen induced 1 n=1 Tax=Amazona collaria TaxID=241587 RepID=A0A8B9FWN0_9PSIT